MDENYRKPEQFTVSRILWWFLAILLAVSFALLSWSWCYYLFGFPEKEKNFKLLKRLGYIGEVQSYTPLNAPPAQSATAQYLYELVSALDEEQVSNLNKTLLRGYLTNYEKISVYRYLEGEFRITSVRALKENDLLYPGLLIKARSYIQAAENDLSSPYPLVIDYFIPTDVKKAQGHFQEGDRLELEKSKHCATILHVAKEGLKEEPTLRCAVVPLAYNIYITPDRQEIPLSAPDNFNIGATLPVK